jgi:transposase InsO family protein
MQGSELEELYQSYNFPSAGKLFIIAKKEGLNVKLKDVEEFVKSKFVNQVHSQQKHTSKGHIVAFYPNESWQADLLDFSKYDKENKGFNWLLIAVDVFTRKAHAIALKTKSNKDIIKGFETLFKNGKPFILTTDNGKEFIGKETAEFLKENDIFHNTNNVGDHNALGIIDAFSRTVKNMIGKLFTHNNNVVWVNSYKGIIETYNNMPHSSLLNISPDEAQEKILALSVVNEKKAGANKEDKLKVGDTVRMKENKKAFQKGYLPTYSKKTYKIVEINGLTATLDNDKEVKTYLLLEVPETSERIDENEDEKHATTRRKVGRQLNRRVKEKDSGIYEITRVLNHEGSGKTFKLGVIYKGYKDVYRQPIDDFIFEGNLMTPIVFRYITKNKLFERAGIDNMKSL